MKASGRKSSDKQKAAASKTISELWGTAEFRAMMTARMSGENNPAHGKMSDLQKENLKRHWESLKGSKRPHSEETKEKIRAAHLKRSAERKMFMGEV